MLIACPVAGKQKAVDICNAFIAGAPKDATGHVFYGVNASNVDVFRRIKARGETWWLADNSYFDCARGVQFRVTRNALQHTGAGDTDFKRFNALGIEIKPWQDNLDGHIVVCPQSDDFMQHVVGYQGGWLQDRLEEIPQRFGPGMKVRVRPWLRDKAKLAASLEADLVGARALVTHSSAAAITAVLAGILALTDPSHPARMAGDRVLKNNATRHHWAGVLADNQFTLDEMRSGYAWAQLHK